MNKQKPGSVPGKIPSGSFRKPLLFLLRPKRRAHTDKEKRRLFVI